MKRTCGLLSGLVLLSVIGVSLFVAPVMEEPQPGFGWIPDPTAVREVKAGLPHAEFSATEAFAAEYDGPDDVFLWSACRKATGNLLPPRNQGSVGACVGFGTAAAVEHLMCVQIVAGSGKEFRDVSPEAIYAGSRVQIGGGRIAGDGSVGAWAAKFTTDYGLVPRGKYNQFDLTKYDESRCREMGRAGLTPELQLVAKKSPVQAVSNVRSWPEAQAAIRNGYPLAVCSSQGFTRTRDADGFARPQGTWMHCMALVGIRGGPRPGGFLLNSWGIHAHSGPLGPGEPSPAGFWVDAVVLDRMLTEGDSWAFSGFPGFPARKLNWYARN